MADTIRTGIVGATVTQGGSGWGANAHVPALHLDGTMVILAPGAFNIGPNVLYAAQGSASLAEMPAPAQYTLVPEGTPPGPPRNVAQTHRRAAHAFTSGTGFEVNVDLAVTRHTLIDAIERSAAAERVVTL